MVNVSTQSNKNLLGIPQKRMPKVRYGMWAGENLSFLVFNLIKILNLLSVTLFYHVARPGLRRKVQVGRFVGVASYHYQCHSLDVYSGRGNRWCAVFHK